MIRTSRYSGLVALALAIASLLVVMLGFARSANADPSCPATTVITAIPPTDYVTSGTTAGGANNVPLVPIGCNGRFTQVAGPEAVFAVDVNSSASFDITVTPNGIWDPSIYFVTADGNQACTVSSCTSTLGADDGGQGASETLHISGVSPTRYYIVVDSFYTTTDARSSGSFTLTLHGTLGGTPTTTTLTSDVNPSEAGQTATITAVVAPTSGGGTPTGSVTFVDGLLPGVSRPLNGGAATFTISGGLGDHAVIATYTGDGTFSTSTGSITQTVTLEPATVTISSGSNPSTFNHNVTFSANVSSPFTAPNGGTLTISIDGTDQSQAYAGAPFVISRSDLTPGDHTVTARYSGDGNVALGTSTPLTQHVDKASTSTAVTSTTGGASVVFGTLVTFTATVTSGGGTPTGSVIFTMDTTTTSVPLGEGGVATLGVSDLAVGLHSIHADYVASTDFGASTSAPVSQPISAIPTTTTVSAAPEPTDASQNVTVTAVVTPSLGAGSVIFTIDGVDKAPNAADGTFQTTTLSPGPHAVGARYLGDATHAPSTATGIIHQVNKVPATIAVTSDLTTAAYLQRITLTATISPPTSPFGTPGGTVEFFDGTTSLGTGTLDGSAKATFPTIFPVGAHSITAKFAGDNNFTSATTPSPVVVTVNQAGTQTAAYSASNPTVVGQPLSILTQVTVLAPGAGTPPGTVTFFDDATSLGSITLDGTGNGGLPVTLAVGTHTITAVYSGTASYAGSTSPPLTQTISLTGAAMGLASSSDPAPRGTAVVFTATIISVGIPGRPTGDVAFSADGKPLGTSTLDDTGKATITTTTLGGGSHTITAVYQGDATFPAGTQALFVERITPAITTTTISSTPNPAGYVQPVTFTATVTSASTGTIDGTVFFRDGTSALGIATVTNGTATFTTNGLKAGAHEVNAAYEGNTDFAPSYSAPLEQTINGPVVSTGGDAGAPLPDAGAGVEDGGGVADSGATGPSDASTTPRPTLPQFDAGALNLAIGGGGEDCSCRTVGGGGTSGGMAVFAGLGLAAALGRRRARRHRTTRGARG